MIADTEEVTQIISKVGESEVVIVNEKAPEDAAIMKEVIQIEENKNENGSEKELVLEPKPAQGDAAVYKIQKHLLCGHSLMSSLPAIYPSLVELSALSVLVSLALNANSVDGGFEEIMIWEERVRDNREQNGGPPCGQVRVLVAGDSGVGKTSLVHLIVKGCATSRPSQTVGCTVEVRHITHGSSGSSSSIIKGDAERDFFVELWDISGHDRYKDCRSLFYKQINGVIFVHDLSQRRTKSSLHKWAAEIAATGTFSAPLGSGGPGGLPVPYLVIGNKTDLAANDGGRVSSGNLVDVARQWVEKQGLLPSSDELPLTESFPGSSGFRSVTK
ncbi:putative GTP-binding protein [Dendrobium catenatum]|uniref:Putative GTP-binding protein n=1 Tax=Dendrobium catenatum TaxID=906689 RepID=A0A2I0X320_9ASPA|nr:putative GTP-binding protein [Dendrobium catenatum]